MRKNRTIDRCVPKVEDTNEIPIVQKKYELDWDAMERESNRRWRRSAIIFILIVIFLSIFSIVYIKIPPEAHAEMKKDGSNAGANAVTVEDLIEEHGIAWDIEYADDEVTVYKATNEPIPVLPHGWHSFDITDRQNRSYTVITNGNGVAVIPTLDENGEQIVIPKN